MFVLLPFKPWISAIKQKLLESWGNVSKESGCQTKLSKYQTSLTTTRAEEECLLTAKFHGIFSENVPKQNAPIHQTPKDCVWKMGESSLRSDDMKKWAAGNFSILSSRNLTLVNIVCWAVYAASESEACPTGQNCPLAASKKRCMVKWMVENVWHGHCRNAPRKGGFCLESTWVSGFFQVDKNGYDLPRTSGRSKFGKEIAKFGDGITLLTWDRCYFKRSAHVFLKKWPFLLTYMFEPAKKMGPSQNKLLRLLCHTPLKKPFHKNGST